MGGAEHKAVRLVGGYRERQMKANALKCTGYAEFHLNALEYDRPGPADNPAMVICAENASDTSKRWGFQHANAAGRAFDLPVAGVQLRRAGQRGYWNLYYAKMPAILIEPLFISDPDTAAIALSEEGVLKMAEIFMTSTKSVFPEGGLFGLSVGHIGARPGDRGAPARGHDGSIVGWEGEICERVVSRVLEAWT